MNQCYIVGDGLEIKTGKDLKEMLQILLIVYYVFDLSYPKCYQLLGFLQFALFQDSAPFSNVRTILNLKRSTISKKMTVTVNCDDCKENGKSI